LDALQAILETGGSRCVDITQASPRVKALLTNAEVKEKAQQVLNLLST
jgi:hypothetical protein